MEKVGLTKRHDLNAGLDEVGMGAVSGCIVIAVTGFWTQTEPIPGVKDSKQLSPSQRQALIEPIMAAARWFSVGWASPGLIDKIGLQAAWQEAASIALHNAPEFKCLYVDGKIMVQSYPGSQKVEPKADSKYWECSAASVVAKVIHDNDMAEMSKHYTSYHWLQNQGYGTQDHMKAIEKFGLSRYHRKSFTGAGKKLIEESALTGW